MNKPFDFRTSRRVARTLQTLSRRVAASEAKTLRAEIKMA